MKKLILSFFILLIFSQLTFSQSEVFAEYGFYTYKRNGILQKREVIAYVGIILYKNYTFKFIVDTGVVYKQVDEGNWQIIDDTLNLNSLKDFQNKNSKYLIRNKKIFAIYDTNQVKKYGLSRQKPKQIKNKS